MACLPSDEPRDKAAVRARGQVIAGGCFCGSVRLDDPSLRPPCDHTFVSSRLGWIRLADGLPEYRGRREGEGTGDSAKSNASGSGVVNDDQSTVDP